MPQPRPFLGQPTRTLAGAPQGRFGIAPRHWIHQGLEGIEQQGIRDLQRPSVPTGMAHAPGGRGPLPGWLLQFAQPGLIVTRDGPGASASAVTPPQPGSRASAAAH
jgi:hypothetical protein